MRKSRSQSILPMETNVPSQSALARNGRHERRISLAESMPGNQHTLSVTNSHSGKVSNRLH